MTSARGKSGAIGAVAATRSSLTIVQVAMLTATPGGHGHRDVQAILSHAHTVGAGVAAVAFHPPPSAL